MSTFTAEVDAWVLATRERMRFVFLEAAQRVIGQMQRVGPSVANPDGGDGGKMPVDIGFLRSSLRVTLNEAFSGASISAPVGDTFVYSFDDSQISLSIAAAQIGDSIYAVYIADYARRLNYGFVGQDSLGRSYDQQGYHFVEFAVGQWQTIVDAVVAEAKSRSAGNAGR